MRKKLWQCWTRRLLCR